MSPNDNEKVPADPEAGNHVERGEIRGLSRKLKGRHMQMIAIGRPSCASDMETLLLIPALLYIGGSIGAGLFVGSGGALHNGGPASLVRVLSYESCLQFTLWYCPSCASAEHAVAGISS